MAGSDGRSVLVIGAGMAGLACASVLSERGLAVTVLDKAHGAGGRASTRRAPDGSFDHGAQYFTARAPAFVAAVEQWEAAGAVARWAGRIGTLAHGRIEAATDALVRWVGAPRMSTLLRHLCNGLDACFEHRAITLRRDRAGWRVACQGGASLGPFDVAVVATPPPQAIPLLDAAPPLAAEAARAEVDPCWAVMLGFDRPLPIALDGAFVQDSPLAWAARDGSKPGRPPGERWVLHASAQWSAAHVDAPREEIVSSLRAAFGTAAGIALPEPLHQDAHRWLYAQTRRPLDVPCLLDPAQAIGACGDWCLGGRLESAWQSGHALGKALAARLA